jgi:aspartyl/asparaginyl beta-hydroxylase (cupin superfamily)
MPERVAIRDLTRLLLGHTPSRRNAALQDAATRAIAADGHAHWTLDAVNASLRVREALAERLYLEPRQLMSRTGWKLRERGADRRTSRLALSLLCPTRERARRVECFLGSVWRTAAAPGRIEVLLYVDDDDQQLADYQRIAARQRACSLHVGPPVGVPRAWNVLAAAATGDLLLMANDDQVYVDYGWDVRLDDVVADALRAHPDGVLCAYFDADQYPAGAADFPIVSRAWYEALGYFAPEMFRQWEVEQWIFDLARRIDRLRPVPGVLVDHRHYQDYKAPFDRTYQRHRATRATSFADHALFLRAQADRKREAERLRRAIEGRVRAQPGRSQEEPVTTPATQTPTAGAHAYALQSARRHYGNLIDALRYAGRDEDALDCARLAVRQGLWAHELQRPREYVPGLPIRPLYDPSELWLCDYLAERYPQIRAEVDAALDPARAAFDPMVDEKALLGSGTWEQAQLYSGGRRNDEACARFPVTAGIVAEIPEATTFGPGVVALSRLHPGSHISPHCGPTNAVLRVHLGVKVPDAVSIRVGDEIAGWREGRCLVFDDSFEHEVWHEGDQERVVLILDVPHPALPEADRERLLERRLSLEEEVVAFMRERGFARIEATGDQVALVPNDATRDLVRRYIQTTGVAAVELRGGTVEWRRA